MDNFHISVESDNTDHLLASIKMAFGRYKGVVGYSIAPKTEKRHPRLIFYWTEHRDMIAFPFKMDAEGAADFAKRWLEAVEYGPEPDHDGDNGKGFRVFNEGWGHVDNKWEAFIAVEPQWAMYGK